jgi:hypothetical protein
MRESRRSSPSVNKMWWALLVVWGLSLVAFLHIQQRRTSRQRTRPSVVLLERGAQVDIRGMTAVDLEGKPRLIHPQDSAVVLLILSPQCSACRKYLPTYSDWETHAARTHAAFRIVLIGQDNNDSHFIQELPGSALVLLEQDPALRIALKARLVPLAIRLEADGTVASVLTPGPDWPPRG